MFPLMCAWTNGWANSPDAGDLRRHGAHCDVTVMHPVNPLRAHNITTKAGAHNKTENTFYRIYRRCRYNTASVNATRHAATIVKHQSDVERTHNTRQAELWCVCCEYFGENRVVNQWHHGRPSSQIARNSTSYLFMVPAIDASKFDITGSLRGESTGDWWLPSQRPSNVESSISWRHRAQVALTKDLWGSYCNYLGESWTCH